MLIAPRLLMLGYLGQIHQEAIASAVLPSPVPTRGSLLNCGTPSLRDIDMQCHVPKF